MDTDKYRSTSVPIDVTVTSDRETVASRGEYTPAGDGFVLTFSIGDGKYEITHGESDTVLSVGGLLSYTISFAAAGAVIFIFTDWDGLLKKHRGRSGSL